MDEELELNELRNGHFASAEVDNWFGCYAYDEKQEEYFKYVKAALDGLGKRINYDLFNFIAIYADYFYTHEDAVRKLFRDVNGIMSNDDRFDEYLTGYISYAHFQLKQILEKIIAVGSRHGEYLGIVRRFYRHQDEMVRLFCAANTISDDCSIFINDPSERVKKVALIRENHCCYVPDDERGRIDFLTRALMVKAITTDYEAGYCEKEDVTFYSILFEAHSITIPDFDCDILYRIADKSILASKIEEEIVKHNIPLNWDMLPECFNELRGITKGRK